MTLLAAVLAVGEDWPEAAPPGLTAPRPPRIALVAPGPDAVGGQEVQASALFGLLREEGFSVVRVPINPDFPAGLRWLRRVRCARTLLNEALYLGSLLKLRGADVAHVFSASYWSFLLGPAPALLAGRLCGVRVVLHYHSGEADDHLKHWGLLVHPWLRLADAVVVPSDYLRTVFARHGHAARAVPNVVDTSSFRFRERRPVRPRFLSTRNLEPHYRIDQTLRAFAQVRERHPLATLTVAGAGTEEGRLRALAGELGGRGIHFAGAVERRQMPALYDECDIFLNSSVVDNQPVSVLEAFAAGLPVITTATGDLSRMIEDGCTGVLVPPRDPSAMAAAACRLLDDPDRAGRMALQARQEVEKHSWPRVRREWFDIYDTLCP